MIKLADSMENKPQIKVLINMNKTIRAIPPMVLVRNMLFLLIGLDITKSTLFFLKTKPNKDIDNTIGMKNKPRYVTILKLLKSTNVLFPLDKITINTMILIKGTKHKKNASNPFDFLIFSLK